MERTETDVTIISSLADLMAENTTRLDCLYDESVLPHPKEAIIAAIERQIVRTTLEEHVALLRSAAVFLCNFIGGIGPDPLALNALDISKSARGDNVQNLSHFRD